METSFIITFIGDDRPGLVEALASTIEKNQGNWQESRLSQLGGKFAGLILVSLPESAADTLQAELKALSSSGLSVRVSPASAADTAHGKPIALSVLGPDRPGIIKEISRELASHDINVVEMDSQVESAAMSGEPMFRAKIDAEIPEKTDRDALESALESVANKMTLDIDLD
ncbi:hypothetical protein A3709_09435 [Halioglobus sp. HI00S01]|uniref:glycine cleavage system protein R n=1 Tax=Halioglobus sp. HI00S01 TaxID=1822214 RepID=UPI0007C23B64|nr:ACT domain-containing protein [Halioglobus sp. HI00S01]KZX53346.1 hypothetical protein A3709_09435 [Halioglobus sp. HI00S01]